jgi:hypothetical protein
MYRDTKVGLALGILIVGITAALFYRTPPASNTGARLQVIAPGLADIDKELQHKAHRPYLPNPTTTDNIDSDHEGSLNSFPKLSEILYTGNMSAPQGLDPHALPLPPGSNSMVSDSPFSPLNKIPNSNTPQLQPTLAGEKIASRQGQTDMSTSGASKTHVVAHGETLSSIAQHYMGSPMYFQEIFTANQEQLGSPDSIRPGMTLVIPPKSNGNIASMNRDDVAMNIESVPSPQQTYSFGRNKAKVTVTPPTSPTTHPLPKDVEVLHLGPIPDNLGVPADMKQPDPVLNPTTTTEPTTAPTKPAPVKRFSAARKMPLLTGPRRGLEEAGL